MNDDDALDNALSSVGTRCANTACPCPVVVPPDIAIRDGLLVTSQPEKLRRIHIE